jgi:Ca-activated chloride channel family protein
MEQKMLTENQSEFPIAGQMKVLTNDASSLPLKNTRVNVQILGPLASVEVIQSFENPFQETIELEYLFPLPKEAAVMGFEITAGGRSIQGKVEESSRALDQYQQAAGEGRRAGLLEQRRPNLFAVQLANIRSGEDIRAVLHYQQRLSFTDNTFEFVFPMGLTPRFHSIDHPEESAGVDAPIAQAGEKIGPVELSIDLDAGQKIDDPVSPTHPLICTRLDDCRFQIKTGEPVVPDHDLIVRYRLQPGQVGLPAWGSGDDRGGYFLATLIPPKAESEDQTQARDFIFVLDRSGSMMGQPIAQARNALQACLRILNPEDTFRILLFDDRLEWYRNGKPQKVEQKAVDRADEFIQTIDGRGGTEIVPALTEALTRPGDSERTRFILFLTDGAVSSESRALEVVRKHLGSARIFTFGIGPSVNRALLQSMARYGRGAAEFLQLDEDIEGAIIRFQDRITFPILSDVSLSFEGAKIWDVYPSVVPDLYADQPIEISGRFSTDGEKPIRIIARGKRNRKNIEVETELIRSEDSGILVQRSWAKARIDDMEEKQDLGLVEPHKVRSEIISLALESQLVTEFTSFVAIDQDVNDKIGSARKISVSQPLPAGLDPAGFTGSPFGSLLHRLGTAYQSLPSCMPAPTSSVSGPFHRKLSAFAAASHLTSDLFSPEPEMDIAPRRSVEPEIPTDTKERIRKLARCQKINGSWNDDVETTAAAVLAFIRCGNTTHRGAFRLPIRKAVTWLISNPGKGTGAFIRAYTLNELARITQQPEHIQASQNCLASLSVPAMPTEQTIIEKIGSSAYSHAQLSRITSLDDLRLAGIEGSTSLSVSPEIQRSLNDELVLAWMACMQS